MTRDSSLNLLHDARRATATAAAILALTLGVAASASAFGGPGGPVFSEIKSEALKVSVEGDRDHVLKHLTSMFAEAKRFTEA